MLGAAHDSNAINKALDAIWKVVADANRYFAGQEPWALKKTDPARMATVLYVTALRQRPDTPCWSLTATATSISRRMDENDLHGVLDPRRGGGRGAHGVDLVRGWRNLLTCCASRRKTPMFSVR
jgi:hypothetical protein